MSDSVLTDIINIFVKHYNNTNDTHINMFSGLDSICDTNAIMEELLEHIEQYKNSPPECYRLFGFDEIDINDYEQLFGIIIDDNMLCVCELMIPLLKYIAQNIDWNNTDWKIIPIAIKHG